MRPTQKYASNHSFDYSRRAQLYLGILTTAATLILSAALSNQAHAQNGQAATVPQTMPSGLPPEENAEMLRCGQSCRYRRANEKLITNAFYLIEQFDLIQTNRTGRLNKNTRQNLGLNCEPVPSTDPVDYDLCVQQYGDIVQLQLTQIRTALLLNSDAVHRLTSKNADPHTFDWGFDADSVNNKPIKSEVLDKKQMQAEIDRLIKKGEIIPNKKAPQLKADMQAFIRDLRPIEAEDALVATEVAIYPHDSKQSSKKMSVAKQIKNADTTKVPGNRYEIDKKTITNAVAAFGNKTLDFESQSTGDLSKVRTPSTSASPLPLNWEAYEYTALRIKDSVKKSEEEDKASSPKNGNVSTGQDATKDAYIYLAPNVLDQEIERIQKSN